MTKKRAGSRQQMEQAVQGSVEVVTSRACCIYELIEAVSSEFYQYCPASGDAKQVLTWSGQHPMQAEDLPSHKRT